MVTKEQVEQLQQELYAQYLASGWHLKPRSLSTLTNLLHSELSEAMEGNRKNLMDDKLPHHRMELVEVADFVIRALNWMAELGYTDIQMFSVEDIERFQVTSMEDWDIMDFIAEMHVKVSINYQVMRPYELGHVSEEDYPLVLSLYHAVSMAFILADRMGWDLIAIAKEKNAFNGVRPDHTLEERAKEHGKAY